MVHADYSNLKSGDFSKEETLQHVLDSYQSIRNRQLGSKLIQLLSIIMACVQIIKY